MAGRHRWLAWGVIVSSWGACAAVVSRLPDRFVPRLPPSETPAAPVWLPALACGVLAFLAVALASRRGRLSLRPRRRPKGRSAHGAIHLEAFAFASLVSAALLLGFALSFWVLGLILSFFQAGVVLGAVYAFVRCDSVASPLAEWGWRRGRGVVCELGLGVLFGLLLAPLLLVPETVLVRPHAPLSGHAVGWLWLLVWVPALEETAHRGMLYRHLRDRWPAPLAVLASAVVFAAFHFSWRDAALAAVGGLVYGLLREWRVSLLAPVAAHATFNAVVVLA